MIIKNHKPGIPKKNLPVVSVIAIGITIAICIPALLGRFTQDEFLKSVGPGAVDMTFNEAAGFVFSSIVVSLTYLARKNKIQRFVSVLLAVMVFLTGLFALIEYVSGINISMDQLFIHGEYRPNVLYSGQPSFLSAVNFLLIGAGLLLLNKEKAAGYHYFYLSGVAITCLILLIGLNFITDVPPFLHMPIRGAIAFITIVVAIWTALPVMQKKIRFEYRLLTGFTALIILIAIISLFSSYYRNRLISTFQLVNHTNYVLSGSEQILLLAKEMESGGRGFIITTDSNYLRRFTIAKNTVFTHILNLKELTKDNPGQQVRIDSLSTLINQRIAFSQLYIQLINDKAFDKLNALNATRMGNSYTEKINNIILAIQQEENNLLSKRQKENDDSIISSNLISYALLLSVFILFVIILISIRNNIAISKKAGNLIKESEAKYRSFFEHSTDGILLATKDGKMLAANPAACLIFAMTEAQICSAGRWSIADITDPRALLFLEERQRTGKATGVVSLLRKGVEKFPAEVSASVFTDADGEEKTSLIIRDMTARKALEDLLDKATRLAQIGTWEVDLVKSTVYWSAITKEIHESEPGFIPNLQTGINFFKEGNSRNLIAQSIQDAIDNSTPWDIELQIISARENEKWVRSIGETEFENGKCVRLYGSFQDIDARKRAELAVSEVLDEKNAILESIDDAFFAVDKNWTVTYWNKQSEKVLGKPRNEVLEHNLWEIFPESVDSESFRKYHEAIETVQSVHFEDYYPILAKWYEVSAYPSGNGLSVYFKDVTERKQSDLQVNELNGNLQKQAKKLAFQNDEKEKRAAELGIANKELAFQNNEKEKRAAELGIANKEFIFQNNEKEKRAAELVIANKELAFQNDEKEKRAAELSIANKELVFQNDEKEKRAAELVIANKELAFQNDEKEKRAAELSIANKELVFQNNEKEKREAELVIANKELAFQNDEKEKRAAELSIANKELVFQNDEKEKRAAELAIANKELAFQNDEKEKREAELVIANKELAFQNHEKEKRAAELSIANKELAISNAELEQFAYVASHDLQEPLRMVTSFLTQLEKKYKALIDDKGRQYIAFAVDGAKRMRQIILALLEFSRIGRTEDSKEKLDLNELVNDIQILFRKQMEEKNAIIGADKLPVMHAYKAPIHQVFQNLISNALKYTKEDTSCRIQISVQESKAQWQFAVADNGIGIGEEYFEKIFIIFQRLHNKDEFSGTGMGLAVSKKIIEGMGGKIWVESKESEGSTFYFTIKK